jgi:hypothetical protein
MDSIETLRSQAQIQSRKGNLFNAMEIYDKIFAIEDKADHPIEIELNDNKHFLTISEADKLRSDLNFALMDSDQEWIDKQIQLLHEDKSDTESDTFGIIVEEF